MRTPKPLRPKSNSRAHGSPLNYSAAVEERYRRKLERLTKRMVREYRAALAKLYASPVAITHGMDAKRSRKRDPSFASRARILTNELQKRFTFIFGQVAVTLADSMVNGAETQSRVSLRKSTKEATGLKLKTSVITGRVREVTKAAIVENVALIKSIPTQYAAQIQGAVMRSVVSGQGLRDLKPQIDKYDKNVTGRAALIARDQTSKVTTAINAARMQDLGIKKFEWLHSGGGKEPRPEHVAMNGNIYSVDDPPIIDSKTGERGLPGQLINCRCRMAPVVDFSDE